MDNKNKISLKVQAENFVYLLKILRLQAGGPN